MKNSKIEWTDHTFNPWIGCTKVSPGCANCYAEPLDHRWGHDSWGPGKPRRRTSASYWKEPLKWNHHAPMLASGERHRVFCASLADWLDDEVPIEWLADLLDLIRRTPNLDWLLLTKRPQNWRKRIEDVRVHLAKASIDGTPPSPASAFLIDWCIGISPANLWLGTTVEDRARADERIPQLLSIPARVRFLSCEPLLGPVDLGLLGTVPKEISANYTLTHQWIDWVICGGENGPKARPMHPDWARSLRDQCAAAGVPFHFKQWGEWLPDNQRAFRTSGKITWGLVHQSGSFRLCLDRGERIKGSDVTWLENETGTTKVGKAAAGRLLDGKEHDGFPQ